MIKLKDLNKEIRSLKGSPIVDFAGKENLTYKSAFISVAEMHKPSNPGTGEALRAFNIGMKFVEAKDSLELESKEIELLKAKTEKLREQKKGMMQVLLTGKKRLKIY